MIPWIFPEFHVCHIIYMVEKLPNNLQKQKIFHLTDKFSLHNIAASSALRKMLTPINYS